MIEALGYAPSLVTRIEHTTGTFEYVFRFADGSVRRHTEEQIHQLNL